MDKVTADSNIFVSAFNWGGNPQRLIELARDGKIELAISEPIVHEIARILGGVAFIEVLTREEDIIGDLEGLTRRPADWYRRLFANAGLVQVAPYCWLSRSLGPFAAALELP